MFDDVGQERGLRLSDVNSIQNTLIYSLYIRIGA